METLNTNHLELALSAITLCVAIVCPVLVTIINSIHSTQIRKLELKYDKQLSYYQKQQSVFNHFLEFASKQLETNYPSEKIEYIRSYHELFLMFHQNIGINYLLFMIRYSTGKTIPRKNYLLLPKHWEKSYKNLTDYSQNYSVDKSDNSPSVLGSTMPITHNASQ